MMRCNPARLHPHHCTGESGPRPHPGLSPYSAIPFLSDLGTLFNRWGLGFLICKRGLIVVTCFIGWGENLKPLDYSLTVKCRTVSKMMLNSERAPGGHVVPPFPLTPRTRGFPEACLSAPQAASTPGAHLEATLLGLLVQEAILGTAPTAWHLLPTLPSAPSLSWWPH